MAEVVSAIRASGGDYTSLSAWEAAEEAIETDLVAAGRTPVAECYNDWAGGLSDAVQLGGPWNCDAANRLIIRAAPGNGTQGPNAAGGVPGKGFKVTSATSWGKTVENWERYSSIQDIEIEQSAASGSALLLQSTGLYFDVVVERCIVKAGGGTGAGGIYGRRFAAIDCLAYDCGAIGFGYTVAWYGYKVRGCVAKNCGEGFRGPAGGDASGQGVELKNCIAYNNTSNWNLPQLYTAGTSNNAASDGATTVPPGSSPYASDVVAADFEDAAGNDFHLASGSGLIGQGADLTAEGITTDVDGDARPNGSAWDIGFDHFVSGGGTQDLAAAGSATADGSAAPKADVALAGVGVALAAGGAGIAADVSISATGITVSGGTAAPVANVSISAVGLAVAAASAGLSADILLAGAASAQAAGNAGLSAQLDALASGAAQSSGSATLDGGSSGELGATGSALATGQAALSITVSLAATDGAQSAGSATLDGAAAGGLAAAGGAGATGSGELKASVTLTAAGFAQAMGAGVLAVQIPLAAFESAQSGGSATLSAGVALLLMRAPGFVVAAPARRFRASAPPRSFRVSR